MIQKMSLFCVGPIQQITTWCRLLMSADTKNQSSETKETPKPRFRPVGPRSGPCSPPPACRGQGRPRHDASQAQPPALSRSPESCRLPSYDGVEGGGGVTLPLDANSVTVPMCWWCSDTDLTVHTFIFHASAYPMTYSGSISRKVFTTTPSASVITRSTSLVSPCTTNRLTL
jgi:hypothetical protein